MISGEKRKLELENQTEEEKVVTIGNYIFSSEALLWAQQILVDALQSPNRLIIIDEIGPLELRSSGLEPVLTEIISEAIAEEKKLILVVRPTLIDLIIAKYNLSSTVVIHHGEIFPSNLIHKLT